MTENVSIYFGDDEEELLERFEDVAVDDGRKRSEEIRAAMRVYLDVLEATENAGWAASSEAELRRSLRSVIRQS